MGAECQDFMKAKGKERRAKKRRAVINGHVNQGSLSPSRQLGQKVDGSKQDDGLTLGKEPEWRYCEATRTRRRMMTKPGEDLNRSHRFAVLAVEAE
ncbi:hypothetical protein Dimus_016340, partial [Dionaea muscipula]